eukprot:2205792-Prymnesium_polylepis.1
MPAEAPPPPPPPPPPMSLSDEEKPKKNPPPRAVMPRALWYRLEGLRDDPDLFHAFQSRVQAQIEAAEIAKRQAADYKPFIEYNVAAATDYAPTRRSRQLVRRRNERASAQEQVRSRRALIVP